MIGLTLFFVPVLGQTVTSVRDGYWDDPATWYGGVAPDPSSPIIVSHRVNIRSPFHATTSDVSITGRLLLEPGATLELAGTGVSRMDVTGVLECANGSLLVGTTASNTRFESGSRYVHRQGPLGFIPVASWHDESTLQISGFIDDGYINIAHSSSWRQSFGHVEYDCPGQTVFIVDLNGHLRDIRGNFTVKNTNGKALRLSTTQQVTINIGGNMIIEGASQVWFSTNSPNCTVNIGGDFQYRSLSASGSYLSTRGNIRINIGGDWVMDAQSVLRMASSAADSTGSRQSRVSLAGDFRISRGGLIAPPAGSGRGVVEFGGSARQSFDVAPIANPLVGNLEYVVNAGAHVQLGESALASDQGALTVNGTLELGSTDASGAIQFGRNGGNIRIPGPRTFGIQSTIVYNGTATQTMGSAHPSSPRTVLDNAEGLVQLTDVTMTNDLTLDRGTLTQAGRLLTVGGNITIKSLSELDNIQLSGSMNQVIDANGTSLQKLTLLKTGGRVELASALLITDGIDVNSAGTVLNSNGHLTLVSSGDSPGHTARIGALPGGSSIQGDVLVQRFMSGEGRLYRYISSPVNNATVSSLMDDFPVTGSFDDPTVAPGIKSQSPSLFEYDETIGEKLAGWKAYPEGGSAANAPLRPGRGYAAFVRNRDSTIIDFSGSVNQGDLNLPLSHTVHNGRPNGWHLVGNPYPSAINWESSALTKNALSHVIVVTDNGDRRFRYWDGDPQFSGLPDGRIASGQSFWVRAISPGASLTFREGAKSADAAFYRRPVHSVPALCIRVSGGKLFDQAVLRLRRQSTDSLDAWDGEKLFNDTLNLSIIAADGMSLAIDSRPALPDSIALNVSDAGEGRYLLTIYAEDSLRNLRYTVKDNYLKQTTTVGPQDSLVFVITDDKESARADRFTIIPEPDMSDSSYGPELVDSALVILQREHQTTEHVVVNVPPDVPCIQTYPNPVDNELIIESCCSFRAFRHRDGQRDPTGKLATADTFHFTIYNAAGMRVDPLMLNVNSVKADSNRTSRLKRCSRFIISVATLIPGLYHIQVSINGITRRIKFVKL